MAVGVVLEPDEVYHMVDVICLTWNMRQVEHGVWESGDGLRRVTYADGLITMWSDLECGFSTTSSFEFLPSSHQDVIDLWMTCVEKHCQDMMNTAEGAIKLIQKSREGLSN